MKDMLLFAAVAAVFAFGWFLMGKLDRILEAYGCGKEQKLPSEGNALRLGFSNSAAADSIAGVLEQYSKLYREIPVRIFSGSEEELLNGLAAGSFDMVFLPENAEIPGCMHYNFKIVSLACTPVMRENGGLPVESSEISMYMSEGHDIMKDTRRGRWRYQDKTRISF